jgi:hypothetical protein
MLVKPEERQPMAALLYFLELGERLAHEVASTQATMAPTSKMRRFLESQARQEAFHATLFRTFRSLIAPCLGHPQIANEPFEEYRAMMIAALRRKDFYESILAEQVILESLGEAILHKLEAGLQKRRAPFRRLRSILLHQEAAHHGFGERVLEQAMASKVLSKQELQEIALPYLALSQAMVMNLQTQFQEIDEDPGEFLSIQQTFFPDWLHSTPA